MAGSSQAESAGEPPAHEGLRRSSVAQLLAALVVVLATMPFVEYFSYGDLVETVLITAVLLAAVPAVGGQRRTLLLAAALVTPGVVIVWLDQFWPGCLPRPLAMLAAIGFVGFVATHLLRFILAAPRVTGEVLCAGVSVYLMLAILWAFIYLLVQQVVPESFLLTVEKTERRALTGFEAVYFSFGTLTTVDYGDIIPVSRLARMAAMLQATTGMFYVTLLIARLVALYSSSKAASSASAPHSQETSP